MTSLATSEPLASTPQSPVQKLPEIQKVVVILIKPTSYDSSGFPLKYRWLVLPTNSLAAMNSLTEQALGMILRPGVKTEIHVLEDGIIRHAKTLKRLHLRFKKGEHGTKLIVGFVGVQTAQFPRARDLVERWQAVGATCVIGGPHVSGLIATMHDGITDRHRPDIPCPHMMPSEFQELMNRGVIVFHGEAEEVWVMALKDILEGSKTTFYRGGQPDLNSAPLPRFPKGYFNGFASETMTCDCGRGCPFGCEFCVVINAMGRTVRFRSPQTLIEDIRTICQIKGKANFFFTDDNFPRNPHWKEILDGLITLRNQGYDIGFIIEADLACGRIPGFIRLLAEAGGTQVFLGLESLDQATLAATGKPQNHVDSYQELFASFHEHGIVVHVGYIVGFPSDTPESVAKSVAKLVELGVDIVSFFMLMYLPGSEDHARAIARKAVMDPDYNNYDSAHVTFPHQGMSHAEWTKAYQKSWRDFYSVPQMIAALKRCKRSETRHSLLHNFVWYRWAFSAELVHPMLSGFFRTRDFRDRRHGTKPLPYWRFCAQEVCRYLRYVGLGLAELYRFQQVVFATECAPAITAEGEKLTGQLRGVGDWINRTFGRAMSRQWLNSFWVKYGQNRWRLLFHPLGWIWHLRMLPHALTEVVYTVRYVLVLKSMGSSKAQS